MRFPDLIIPRPGIYRQTKKLFIGPPNQGNIKEISKRLSEYRRTLLFGVQPIIFSQARNLVRW